MNLYGFANGDPVNFTDPFGLCPPQDKQLWDCGSKYYADRIATGKGIWIVNQVAGLVNTCIEDERCSNMMALALAEGMGSARGRSLGLSTREVGEFAQPGEGEAWTKMRGNQGWRDSDGNFWKKDMLHKDHWDISDSKGTKVREVDFKGN